MSRKKGQTYSAEQKTENKFQANREFLEIINKNQANWFSQDSINVILEIDVDVSEYFLRR
ncbi:hypothetical protein [Candidatus Sulfurimonas baltica]|uniref:Uncharacterized protein n=1 Tax=Candidatus Sulfurimonas baltica TaxID=2740404 RepID=A0A7S7RNG0_9BACT|nr:hypothetical protein [Candidatus Sulfurimonas baltica]QOY52499.1 hypothetical protein HUE88_02035 [Candidatus Sulfurimonas baltica]